MATMTDGIWKVLPLRMRLATASLLTITSTASTRPWPSLRRSRGGANLLPGRIILEHLDPLSVWELGGQFDLARALRVGTLPGIYLDREDGADVLDTYATVYLREEIRAEAVLRDVGSYARFLDV